MFRESLRPLKKKLHSKILSSRRPRSIYIYVKILTWLRGFRIKITIFFHFIAIARRDLSTKKIKPNTEKWREILKKVGFNQYKIQLVITLDCSLAAEKEAKRILFTFHSRSCHYSFKLWRHRWSRTHFNVFVF